MIYLVMYMYESIRQAIASYNEEQDTHTLTLACNSIFIHSSRVELSNFLLLLLFTNNLLKLLVFVGGSLLLG